MTTAAPVRGRYMGPTWERDEDGKFILPKHTIAWDVIDWCETWLLQPDGPNAGEPWRFTREQKRFLAHWYAVDERGRFVYRAGMFRRMKGHGKDPFVAAICCAEFLGPCRFVGWENGEPQSEPHYAATVQIAAVSQDQVKRNTMSLFPAMFSSNAIREYELDIGKEIIWALKGRCRVEMLTTSARSAEGPRPTFIVKNETQHWIPSNGGIEMSEVCARNVAKSRDGSARTLAISNAHAPGELSDAESDYEDAMQGDPGFMYDSLEASDAVVEVLRLLKYEKHAEREYNRLRDILRSELEWCRGDSVWLDMDRLIDECLAPKTRMNEALRFYFNRLAASDERAFRLERWKELSKADWKPEPGSAQVLGFDGSVNDDWTALIATDVSHGTQWVAGIWEPRLEDSGEWRIDVSEVDATVSAVMDTYEVWRMNADPYYWMEMLSIWASRWNEPGHEVVVSYSTTNLKATALATLAYHNAIETGVLFNDGDERMAWAINNAHKRMLSFRDDKGEQMWVIQKERPGSPLKIDPAMAGILSYWAYLAAVASGVLEHSEAVTTGFFV